MRYEALEKKPNEPIDRSFCPTMGHAMAVSAASKDPSRIGGLLETAHAILAGLDTASEVAFALAMGKIWSVHLNAQNGMKYDQDKAFGVENLRQAFNQMKESYSCLGLIQESPNPKKVLGFW